jgi:hypothetical protein
MKEELTERERERERETRLTDHYHPNHNRLPRFATHDNPYLGSAARDVVLLAQPCIFAGQCPPAVAEQVGASIELTIAKAPVIV